LAQLRAASAAFFLGATGAEAEAEEAEDEGEDENDEFG